MINWYMEYLHVYSRGVKMMPEGIRVLCFYIFGGDVSLMT
jgi:hypothetical protein